VPYLEKARTIDGDTVPAGEWVPELGWKSWHSRASGPSTPPWRRRPGPDEPAQWADDVFGEKDWVRDTLARDIGAARRDAHLYSNMIEQLKNNPSDVEAECVIAKMQGLGMASASWPTDVGGPPPHQSLRLFRPVLKWLLGLLKQVGQFLLRCLEKVMRLADRWLSGASFSVGIPPDISFDLSPEIFGDADRSRWKDAIRFIENALDELADVAV
jgi:hypothetical protein